MEEERVTEQKRLRNQELKEANKMNVHLKIEEEKNKIDELEKEAQSLEVIEQELLQKLQSTQMVSTYVV